MPFPKAGGRPLPYSCPEPVEGSGLYQLFRDLLKLIKHLPKFQKLLIDKTISSFIIGIETEIVHFVEILSLAAKEVMTGKICLSVQREAVAHLPVLQTDLSSTFLQEKIYVRSLDS